MTPLHPILLTGAALIALPIVLHLIMRQEPKRLPFPAFRFLKQRRFINQRRIRLRHILLLMMRMLLIALMAMALFQPRFLSERFHIRSEQPLAAVIVIDTSPSMGYAPGETSRLDEARRRALEFLDELPPDSSVAVIDTGDLTSQAGWLPKQEDARGLIESLTATKAGNRPLTSALDQAYRLFQTVDRDRLGPDEQPLPRLMAVFSDRTASSWEAERLGDLESQRDRVPAPEINSVYVDVGVEKPVNMALLNTTAETSFDEEYNAVVDLRVQVRATGEAVENVLVCRIDGESDAERKPVSLDAGQSRVIPFRRTGLDPGMHQAEITLLSTDSLAFDNARFITFLVSEPRPVLMVADVIRETALWKDSLESTNLFRVDVKKPAEVRDWGEADWNQYPVVCLVGVADPSKPATAPLWDPLEKYLERGGNLVILPGGEEMQVGAYNNEQAQRILPGRYGALTDAEDLQKGVTWLWNSLNYQHALLDPFREWEQDPRIDFISIRPRVFRYWKVEARDKGDVIVSYDNTDADPALLERTVGTGKVMMFTVPADDRRDVNDRSWNDYWESSFFFVMANISLTYLVGDESTREVNFQTGQTIRVPLPLSEASKPDTTYILEGPGITGANALIERARPGVGTPEAALTVSRERTMNAGNFTIRAQDKAWVDRFSLNANPAESSLDRLEPEAIETLFGEGTVIAPEKELKLGEVLERRFNQPVNLFPWLMIALLLLFALEGLLANRFYRKPPAPAEENSGQS